MMGNNSIPVDEMNQKITVINNIRLMQGKCGFPVYEFEDLVKHPIAYLRDMQNDLVPEYNKTCNN